MGGVERIAAERKRQVEVEDHDLALDNTYDQGELAVAAACYAVPKEVLFLDVTPQGTLFVIHPEKFWPFKAESFKKEKHLRIRQLEIAGALIAAEIDRLERTEEKK